MKNQKQALIYSVKLIICTLILCLASCKSTCNNPVEVETPPPFQKYLHSAWVDSLMNTLSLEEQIGQLIWVPVRTTGDAKKKSERHAKVLEQISKHKVGGVIYFQSELDYILSSLKEFQSTSEVPLMAALDGEWGVAMRLTGATAFPYAMTLGALQHDSLLYSMGRMMAKHVQLIGMHMNLAPVADVNVEPNNPVIGKRSFGENPQRVSQKAWNIAKGMQDGGLMVSLKHFPGHGDTKTDSHKTLPTVDHDSAQLFNIDLKPYRDAIPKGLAGIMIAHLYIPSLMGPKERPVTLDKPFVTGILKEQLKFNGLIISDAMEMQGVLKLSKEPGDVDAMAIEAGIDVIELPKDVDAAIKEIKKYIEQGRITKDEIAEKCRKVLAVKQWVGLSKKHNTPSPQHADEILATINSPEMTTLTTRLYEEAITLLENNEEMLPLSKKGEEKIALLNLGTTEKTTFAQTLSNQIELDVFYMDKKVSMQKRIEMQEKLQTYDKIIVGVFNSLSSPYSKSFPKSENSYSYGITQEMVKLVDTLSTRKLILVHFGIPYSMQHFTKLSQAGSVIMAYEERDMVETIVAQMVTGATSPKGTLPVSIGKLYKEGDGLTYSVKN